MEEVKNKNKPATEITEHENRCPDYDKDCIGLDHARCYIGDERTGIAKGFCPFIHRTN